MVVVYGIEWSNENGYKYVLCGEVDKENVYFVLVKFFGS